jgi:riboflavin kinase/FMN adenylyltransferase
MTYTGLVVHGRKLGRKLGFPTANLEPTSPFSNMKKGVYAVLVQHHFNQYMGVMNIGQRPTISQGSQPIGYSSYNIKHINNNSTTIEVHILNFDKEIYSESLKVEALSFIRDEKKFNSLEELKQQISEDIQIALEFFSERGLCNGVK